MAGEAYTFLGWNVGASRLEESWPATKWAKRAPRVLDLIRKTGADIVALVELRDISGLNWRSFIGELPQYDPVVRRYGPTSGFAAGLLVDPEKFYVGDTRLHSFEAFPRNDRMVMFVDLMAKATGEWVTVGVTHFAMEEDLKSRAAEKIAVLLGRQAHPTILYGDYNFFEDKDGARQRATILAGARDIAHPLHGPGSRMEGGRPSRILSGTFVGFPHDKFKKSPDSMSRLDHVFVPARDPGSGAIDAGPATSPILDEYSLDNSSHEAYTYPSDHLAICVPWWLAPAEK